MREDHHQGPRGTAGRIGSIALKAIIVVIAMALPLSAGGPGSWITAASLHTARANHAAAMLPNGQALIVGGVGSSGKPLTSAEIFNLSSDSFTTVSTGLATGVSGLTATVLNDNTVLLAGGLNAVNKSVAAAELYDPVSGGFIKLPMMQRARSHHSATLLADGRVLIAGGMSTTAPLANLEIFDPVKRTFTLTASLKYARQDHTATLLTDGTVLIAGGSNTTGVLSSTEIFNPVTGKVTQTGGLHTARTLATASRMYNFDGTVLIEGGQGAGGADLNTAEEYDPATGSFTTLSAHMNTARSGHVGVTLPYNGKVLIAGGTSAGQPVTDNEVYDPISATFAANEPMSVARDEFAANFFAVPAVGQVLMSGGADATGTPLALTEMYAYPTIRTDMADYPPGSPVTITGAGWAPGETVTIQIQETDDDDTWLTDTADSTGSFTDTSFGIADNDGGVIFVMTATGQTSGETAQYRFTDSAHIDSLTVTPSSVTVTAPATASYTVTCTEHGGGNVTYGLSPSTTLPSGAGSSFSTNPTSGCPGGGITLNITTTCASTTTGTSITVQAEGDGDSSPTNATAVTLKVNACAATPTPTATATATATATKTATATATASPATATATKTATATATASPATPTATATATATATLTATPTASATATATATLTATPTVTATPTASATATATATLTATPTVTATPTASATATATATLTATPTASATATATDTATATATTTATATATDTATATATTTATATATDTATATATTTATATATDTATATVTTTATATATDTATATATTTATATATDTATATATTTATATATTTATATATDTATATATATFFATATATATPTATATAVPSNINLALTSGTTPSFYGQPLTFTGTVTDDSANPITCGSLTFYAGANPISGCSGVPLGTPSSDQAQCTTSTITPGSYNITAAYTPSPSGCLYLPGTSNTVGQVVLAELRVTPFGLVFGNSTFANWGTTTTYAFNGVMALNQSAVPVSIGAITASTSTLNGSPVSINACMGGSIPGASCTVDSDCIGGGTCVLNPNFQPVNLYLCTGGTNPGANCLGASDVTSCTGGGTCSVNPSFPPVKLYDCMDGTNPGASCTGTSDTSSCTGGGTCTLVNMYACMAGTNPGAACTGPSDVTSCTGGGTCALNPNFQPCANQTLAVSGTPGDACVFTVSFTATALGNFMGSASVPSGAANTPNTVTLSGTGVAPSINLPPTVSFGNVVVGTTSATKTATVKNTNSVGVTISSVSVSGPFAIVTDGCTGTLAANSSCTEMVSFNPTAAGAASGALTFTGNFSNSGGMVSLTGTGTLNAPTFTPSSLAYGAISVGMNATRTVTVTNPNNVVGIPITSVTVTALSSDYTKGTDTCSGTTLAPGGMCTVSVTFAPTAVGSRPGQLTFVDQGGSGSQKYALSGSGK